MTLTPNTTTIRQGQTVLVPFPFSDQPDTNKLRPALVVSANWLNETRPDCVLAAITSVIPQQLERDMVLLIGAEARQCGLRGDSVVLLGKLFTIEQSKIVHQLSQLTLAARQRAFETLNQVFLEGISSKT